MAKKLKPRYKIALLVIGLGALLYVSLLGARIIQYTGGGLIGIDGALNIAAQADDVMAMRVLLAFGAEADGLNPETGMTPLERAAEANHLRSARFLLEAGAHPDGGSHFWSRPLFLAIVNGHDEMADLLLEHGATYTAVDALFQGDEERVREFLNNDPAALTGIQYYSMSLLKAAVDFRNLKAARILLDLGFDPTSVGASTMSPLDVARRRGQDDFVALFESYTSSAEETVTRSETTESE